MFEANVLTRRQHRFSFAGQQLFRKRRHAAFETLEPRTVLTTFLFNPAPDTPVEVLTGFQEAANLWAAELLDDDVVVRLDIAHVPLGPDVIGATGSSTQIEDYADVLQALNQDASSIDDLDAVASLPTGSDVDLYINLTADNPNGNGSDVPYVDANGGDNNRQIKLNTALAKALGFTATAAVDGNITFNSQFEFDFDRSDGIDPDAIDFVGTAAHEIGHALGFVSGVDDLEVRFTLFGAEDADDIVEVTPLDLFRYSNDSLTQGTQVIDFTADTRAKFFTIDNGALRPGTFSTGGLMEGAFQASHWEDSLDLGLMDPTLADGEMGMLTELDLRAFDVIGWDRVPGGGSGDIEPPAPLSVIQVSGTVFHDVNDNGAQEAGEMGIPGHTVFYDANADGYQGFGEQAAITNAVGVWQMNLDLGDPPEFGARLPVELRLALPPGTVSTSGNPNEAMIVIPTNPLMNQHDIHFGLLENIDYGDAPQDLVAPFTHRYPTVGADAASHGIVPNFFLGTTVDGEPVGLPGISATEDDLTGNDDEDGIAFPVAPLLPGANYSVTVTGSSAAHVGYFQMWVDFNQDGDWDDTGEQVLTDIRLSAGANVLSFPVPATALTGTTYVRGRLGFSRGLGPGEHDLGGEVEDYQIVVGPDGPGPLVMSSSGDLGIIDSVEVQQQQVGGLTLYEMKASHSGLFTVESTPTNLQNDLDLHLYDANGTLLGSSVQAGTSGRLDAEVKVGDKLLLTLSGDPQTVDLRLTNLMVDGDSVYVYGTDDNDTFNVSLAGDETIDVNGVVYNLKAEDVSLVTFYRGEGFDTVNAGSGWIAESDQIVARDVLAVYRQGDTTLRISKDIPITNLQLLGDFGQKGMVDATDIDLLFDALRAGSQIAIFDLNHDDSVNRQDADFLVQEVLHSAYGDADLDQDVDIVDFNRLAMNYNPFATNRNWSQGDYDGDGDVDISDFQKIVRNFDPLGPAHQSSNVIVNVQYARLAQSGGDGRMPGDLQSAVSSVQGGDVLADGSSFRVTHNKNSVMIGPVLTSTAIPQSRGQLELQIDSAASGPSAKVISHDQRPSDPVSDNGGFIWDEVWSSLKLRKRPTGSELAESLASALCGDHPT